MQLEVKTTTVAGARSHKVLVDLGQLEEYRQRRPGHLRVHRLAAQFPGSRVSRQVMRRYRLPAGMANRGSGRPVRAISWTDCPPSSQTETEALRAVRAVTPLRRRRIEAANHGTRRCPPPARRMMLARPVMPVLPVAQAVGSLD